MSLLSLSKKILRSNEAEAAKAKKAKKAEAKKVSQEPAVAKAKAGAQGAAGAIQLTAIMTEKSMAAQAQQKLVVRVIPTATKAQIAAAIEQLFGVKVLGVRTARNHPKIRRRGVSVGRTVNLKKAYVTVDDLSKLNVAP
jgi:large subunit ribosomal protein L23